MTGILLCIIILLAYELIEQHRKRKYNNTIYAVKRNTSKLLNNIKNGNGNFTNKLKHSRYL